MFHFIINFFNKKQPPAQDRNKKDNFCNIYNEQYRDAYSRLWIKKIQNYSP
jgi:hypothetical protein